MSAIFSLADGVYFCEPDSRTSVFLDARQDRYYALLGQQHQWFAEIRGARTRVELSAAAETLANRLCAHGILTMGSHRPVVASVLSHPGSEVQECRSAPARVSHTELTNYLFALISTVAVWTMNKKRPHRLFDWAVRSHLATSCEHPRPEQDINSLVDKFHRLSTIFITRNDACLFRSLLLMKFLSRFRIESSLVVAVRMCPFGAHSWVERKGVALNEALEITRDYTPIAVF